MLRPPFRTAVLLLATLGFALITSSAAAQNNGGGNTNNAAAGGISIDADGVVRPVVIKGRSEKLDKRRIAEAAETLNADVSKSSPMRKVSLVGLERAYEPYAGKDEQVPPEVFHLAGLQRIDYLFIYPDTRDVVIAGPAEGFAKNNLGRVVGVSTGRATLRLDDLVLALRAMKVRGQVGCSIDAVPENLAALQQYVRANSSPTSPTAAGARYGEMARVLGMQNVKVWGVPPDSHFAQSLVEADYRMKRIALGIENSGVRGLKSHLAMLLPQGNSMQRWWMAPLYDAIVTTPERNAYQLAGQRVQLLSQEEAVTPEGYRSDAAFTRLSTQQYAQQFTEKFPELAAASPIFAEVQNLFDLLIVSAIITKDQLAAKVGWEMSTFLDEQRTSFPKSNVPRQVASLANHRRASSGFIVGLISGGVVIRPLETIDALEFKQDTERRLNKVQRESVSAQQSDKKRWWWD